MATTGASLPTQPVGGLLMAISAAGVAWTVLRPRPRRPSPPSPARNAEKEFNHDHCCRRSPYLAAVSDAGALPVPVPAPADGWRSSWFARHRVGLFLTLAFALSWWPWPLALTNPSSTAMVSFGPFIAALVVVAVAGGRHQFMALLRAVGRWRVPGPGTSSRWPDRSLSPPSPAAVAIAFRVGRPSSLTVAHDWSVWASLPLLLVTTALLGGPLFEEVGWRGFLVPEEQRRATRL